MQIEASSKKTESRRRNMSKKKWLLVAGLASLLAMTGLTGCGSASPTLGAGEVAQVNISSQQEGIWVTGEGKVQAVPDIAILRLGVEAQDTSVVSAQTAAAAAMDDVMTALSDSGVASKDIQTQYFNIYKVTRWDRDDEQEVVVGYRVTNVVSAKLRELDRVGSIIDAVAEASGDLTRIDGISFSVDDPTEYYQEAREEAMADAKAKAEQLARLSGVTLGKVTYISEGSSGSVYPIAQPRMAFEMEAGIAKETPISPGEMEIGLNVQVAYSISN
jgi:uncharacterized protein YggE